MAGPSYNVMNGSLSTLATVLMASGIAMMMDADTDIRMTLGFGLAAMGVACGIVKEIVKYFMYKAGHEAPADESEE